MVEFAYGGELAAAPGSSLADRLYARVNVEGVQHEAWFHRFGCECWFEAERDTRTNAVLETR